SVYMAAGKGGFILKRALLMLGVNLILSIWLVRQIGYLGAAVATVALVYLIAIPYNTVYVRRLMDVKARDLLPLGLLGKIMAISATGAVAAWCTKQLLVLNTPLEFLISGAVFASIVLLGFHITRLLLI